jgi:hypothetical protein
VTSMLPPYAAPSGRRQMREMSPRPPANGAYDRRWTDAVFRSDFLHFEFASGIVRKDPKHLAITESRLATSLTNSGTTAVHHVPTVTRGSSLIQMSGVATRRVVAGVKHQDAGGKQRPRVVLMCESVRKQDHSLDVDAPITLPVTRALILPAVASRDMDVREDPLPRGLPPDVVYRHPQSVPEDSVTPGRYEPWNPQDERTKP